MMTMTFVISSNDDLLRHSGNYK